MIAAPTTGAAETRASVKSYHILPLDDDDDDDRETSSSRAARSLSELREPLQSTGEDARRRSKLATSRVQRDRLLRKLEELALTEAELASAYELFDYTRKRCSLEHEQIVGKLNSYEAQLRDVQAREAAMRRDGGVLAVLTSDADRERWRRTQEMVAHTLPELLARLEDNIDLNSAKIRGIQDKLEQIRAHRLAVREEIAVNEEDIALALQ